MVLAVLIGVAPTVQHLFLSPGHNYFGHHGRPASDHPSIVAAELPCVAGRGVRGDRFFDYRADYPGQITFFAEETFEALIQALGRGSAAPATLRRNVVTRGIELLALINREFCLQGVWFRGASECKPCYWMDRAVGPGAEAWLRGRGGLRARILSDGTLRVGTADFTCRATGGTAGETTTGRGAALVDVALEHQGDLF